MKKKKIYPASLPVLTLAAGFVGMLLRLWLLSGVSEEGLLKAWHPAAILSTALTFGVIGFLIFHTRKFKSRGKYRINFPASLPAALCCWLAAAALFLRGMGILMEGGSRIHIIAGCGCIAAVPCLILTGLSRFQGKRSVFLLHVATAAAYALLLLLHYQSWSSSSVVHLHIYRMLALAGMMLTTIHRAEFDLRIASRRVYAPMSLCALYFCLNAIAEGDGLFFLIMALWLLTNQCALVLPRRRRSRQPAPEEAPAEPNAQAEASAPAEETPEAPESPAEPGQEEV